MKFIKSFFLFVVVPTALIITIALFCWTCFSTKFDLGIDQHKNIVVFGSSSGECSFNDSILQNYYNCCTSGMNYIMQKDFIKSFILQNNQIDTVLLEIAQSDWLRNIDFMKRDESISYYANFQGYIAYKRFRVFSDFNLNGAMNSVLSLQYLRKPSHGFYNQKDKNNLDDSIAWFNSMYPSNTDSLSFQESLYRRKEYNEAIREIVDFCRSNGKRVIIVNPPCYHTDYWFDAMNYYKFIATFEGKILFADYNDFEFPDSSYYANVGHLNGNGAGYFSNFIKNCGLKTETPVQYYNRKCCVYQDL